jgi:uncharacterized membrane protein YfcA
VTRPGEALRLALRDLYENSWRLLPVNAALGALLVAVGIAAYAIHAAILLLVLAGPVAAALAHAAVTLVQTGNVTVRDARAGLRLHWRRGLELAAVGTAVAFVGALAIRFYAHAALPLAFAAAYLLVLAGVYALLLWTLAVARPEQPLRAVARDAAVLAARRPGATLVLGLALAAVNLVGAAAAAMPFLTLTIAYSFVAAAHFALPRPTTEEPL